jgi:hypothetical protein
VHLKDADRHVEGEGAPSRDDFLARARRHGVWPNHRMLTVPAERVRRVSRLADN